MSKFTATGPHSYLLNLIKTCVVNDSPQHMPLLSSNACPQEIASPLESSVSSPDLPLVTSEQQKDNTLQLQLQPSLALWHALQRYSQRKLHLPMCSTF